MHKYSAECTVQSLAACISNQINPQQCWCSQELAATVIITNSTIMIRSLLSVASTLFIGWLLIKWLLPWLPCDLKYLSIVRKMMSRFSIAVKNQVTPAERLRQMASSQPDKPFILFEDEVWSYRDMNLWVNRMTRALHELELKEGDQVALMMSNEPAYAAIFIACMQLGVEVGLINYNLRSSSLLYSFKLLESKYIIVGGEEELLKAITDIQEEMAMPVISFTENIDGRESLKDVVDRQSSEEIGEELQANFSPSNTACYIYTSGTTGKPKAVKFPLRNVIRVSQFSVFWDCRDDDVIYCSLPFYHGAGCMAGLTTALYAGITLALRRRFSASNCLKDCIKYKATALQYIGETMRYICLQPPSLDDKRHNLRVAYGNGLRADVWKTFHERFGKQVAISEFYAATEGNASFANVYNIPVAVGLCSPLMKFMLKLSFIRYDHEEGRPFRDSNGRCIEVPLNEPGLVIRRIDENAMHCEYKGDENLTEAKILRNVFEEGDSYFNSGDLLIRDNSYVVYFCDRVGDTFRWKGENVSTNEVSDVLVTCPNVAEAIVYEVKVKGSEGRAGMVTVSLQDPSCHLDFEELYNFCKKKLPKYAIPLFVRIEQEVDHTGTMKQVKVKLKNEGCDLEKISGKSIYFLHPSTNRYEKFTPELQKEIENGFLNL